MPSWSSVPIACFLMLIPRQAQGQETWLQRFEELRALETVASVSPPMIFDLADDRRFQNRQFDLGSVTAMIDRMAARRELEWDEWVDEDPQTVSLEVGFFGLFRTSGGTWGARFLGNLRVSGSAEFPGGSEYPISQENILGKREPKEGDLQAVAESILREVESEIEDVLNRTIRDFGSGLRKVVAFGKAPLRDGTPKMEIEEEALNDAIRRAIELAWGSEVVSTTRVQDFGGARVEMTKTEAGWVRWSQILTEFTRETDDGFLTILAMTILGQPHP